MIMNDRPPIIIPENPYQKLLRNVSSDVLSNCIAAIISISIQINISRIPNVAIARFTTPHSPFNWWIRPPVNVTTPYVSITKVNGSKSELMAPNTTAVVNVTNDTSVALESPSTISKL